MQARIPVELSLAPFVREIVVQRPSDEPYTVLPGPLPVLGFQWTGTLYVTRNEDEVSLSQAGIAGLQRGPQTFRADPHTQTVLILFQPEGAFRLLGFGMDELSNANTGLDNILPPSSVHEIAERMWEAATADDVARVVQGFLRQVLDLHGRPGHHMVSEAVASILACNGSIRVQQLARQVSMSPRQLERVFRHEIGASPKRFADLVRFSCTLAKFSRSQSMADLAYVAGYADQAHFIRTFGNFAGTTPMRLFKRERGVMMSHSFNTQRPQESTMLV